MKKLIYHLFFYIGLITIVVNPLPLRAETLHIPMDEFLNKPLDPSKPLIEADNEFIKLYVVYVLVDKLYPEGDINQDITPFLQRVWPNTKASKLKKFSGFLKTFIMGKRRYDYVVNHLKQKIKAASLLPEDAPIIAADGEFAPKYSDKTKQTAPGEYKVSYTPYKYIGYDPGELGEPVRMRDKNYEPIKDSVIDELTLSLLKFDIAGFVRALNKYPSYNDGSREKIVELGDGVRSRLLSDTSHLGQAETIKAVLEVYTPKTYYINGDFINPRVKPQFYLSEDTKEDLNIKDYELFYPEAAGVVNDNQTSRILVGSTLFPIKITRRDTSKPLTIKGKFIFSLCRAKTKDCHPVVSENSLTLEPSNKAMRSMHAHFVDKGFYRVPPQQSKHASLKSATFNPMTGKLTAKFKTTKTFSNVAVMAEDANETNFINPQYSIDNDEVTVTFDSTPSYDNLLETNQDNISTLSAAEGGEIALTAGFDKLEVMRTTITPEISIADINTQQIPTPFYGKAFLFGLLLNLLPAVLYMLERLLRLLIERKNRYQIMLRYGIGSAIGLACILFLSSKHPWYAIYENPYLISLTLLLAVAYLTELWGYMDFNLFRPFKGIIRRGFFIGLFTILFAILCPAPYKAEALSNMNTLPLSSAIKNFVFIWLGVISLPLILLFLRRHLIEWPIKLHFLNKSYILLYILWALWLAINAFGWKAGFLLCLCGLLSSGVWYIYPLAIGEATSHRRDMANKNILFQKVQQHCSLVQGIIYLTTIILVSLLPLKKQSVPPIDEVLTEAQTSVEQNQPLMFVLSAPWSLHSIANSYTLQKLSEKGVLIKRYSPEAENAIAASWYKFYGKQMPPLNILFTSRHKEGLSLPSRLKKIDWSEAIADF